MIDALLELPTHRRERLARALASGLLVPPYEAAALSASLGQAPAIDTIAAALRRLDESGIPGPAIALALDAAARAGAKIERPALVWSGPEVPGLHARDTARVYEELLGGARRSLWISTFAYYDGPRAFATLAARMDANPELTVTLLLNIGRRPGETAAPERLVMRFAERLWRHDWPGERAPEVFYDPRSLEPSGAGGVLHAKAIVADEEVSFLTSANLTEAAFERNIELGVISRDVGLATSVVRHFQTLIERGILLALPSA